MFSYQPCAISSHPSLVMSPEQLMEHSLARGINNMGSHNWLRVRPAQRRHRIVMGRRRAGDRMSPTEKKRHFYLTCKSYRYWRC